MRKYTVLFILFFLVSTSFGQYTPNKSYLGPSLGLSFLGSTPQFGANYEYSMVWENFGTVGLGAIFRYWSYSEDFGFGNGVGKWSYSDVLIGAQGNYHFNVDNDKLDPWAGLVLAYDAGSVTWDGPGGYNYASPSYGGVFLGLHGGLRYWLTPTIALSGRIGYGSLSYGALDVGVDFKF